jgi:lysozyme family protein
MAADNFDHCLHFTLQFEGGFVNNPNDPGGPTNLGVTQATLSLFLGRPASIPEVRALTPEKVAPIYKLKFWHHVNGDDLPLGVDLAVFDFGVHSGPSRGAIGLQRALGLADDGKIGDVTLAAANAADPGKLVNDICDERLAFLKQLKVFQSFKAGLTNRVARCRDAAESMLDK